MVAGDTSMGGDLSRFPSTSLSMVLEARENRDARVKDHMERLCSAYWKPVYFYIRRVWSKSDADAKDLAQDFFVSLFAYGTLDRFDPGKGNFRAYLKTCLRNFLTSDNRHRGRLKRGGGRSFLPLDSADAVPDSRLSPEDQFDQDWVMEVLMQSIEELGDRLRKQDKAVYFDVYRQHELLSDPEQTPTYQEIAGTLGISKSDVGNYLRVARSELRAIVIGKISEYVADSDEVTREESRILGETS